MSSLGVNGGPWVRLESLVGILSGGELTHSLNHCCSPAGGIYISHNIPLSQMIGSYLLPQLFARGFPFVRSGFSLMVS